MSGIWTIVSAITSFAIAGLLGIWLVPFLQKKHFGQTILEEGPKWHKGKQGTPTMGGFMFIAASIAATLVCVILFHLTGTDSRGIYMQVCLWLLHMVP